MGTDEEERCSSLAGEEDDDEGLIDLIDRIGAVKTRFEMFNNQLKAGTLGSDEEDGGGGAGEDGQEGGSAEGTLDQKIARFEALIGKLHTVVDMMEEEEDGEPAEERGGAGAGAGAGNAHSKGIAGFGLPPRSAAEAGVGQGGEDVDDEDEFAATFATAGFNPVVTEYEKLIQNLLVPFLDAVNAVGGDVRKQGAYVAEAFGAQREMLEEVAQRQKPASEEEFLLLLVPTQEALARIDEINEGAGDLRKHTAMVAGAMTSFGWVTTDEPRAYIGDMLNAVPVYGRQIQADYTGSEHAALVDSLKFLLRGLQDYVGHFHPNGLTWNTRNVPRTNYEASPNSKIKAFTKDNEAKVDEAQKLETLDDFIFDRVVPFVESAYALGSERIRIQTDCVQKVFKAQRDFMSYVVRCRRPRDEDVTQLLQETSEALMEIEECCDNEADERLHLTMVASGMASMAWVSVPINPSNYISDMINSIPVYGDKIAKEAAGKEEDDRERDIVFVDLFRDMLKGLNEYVRQYHAKGLSWNMAGTDLASAIAEDMEATDGSSLADTSSVASPPKTPMP